MDAKRKQYSAEFKLKVVLESFQRDTTQEEVCRKFGIASSMLHRWRHAFQEQAATIFLDQRDPRRKTQALGYAPGESPDDLRKLIGELTVQNAILKKAQGRITAVDTPRGLRKGILPSSSRLNGTQSLA